ncbi:MAG: CRISPR-associated endonuclease Cas1 [Acidimicrobiia bacterium]|nr:CRISPR-associated endonuclease Cas1 [Acidimicrobiia bacterium]
MLNAFTYCPRLFFLEWVQGRFVDNADTVEGRYQHRVVDQERGAAPLPDDGEVSAARSVMLSSTELGLVARIDLIEGRQGTVRPVDTKRGSPPDLPEGAWEPDRVQLCVQGLLLREAGYRCDEGVLYYAEARRRVTVPLSTELVERTLELLDALRATAATDLPPPPLVASKKCPRCSLVGLCLPDETNALADRSDLPVRRLVPRDPSPRPLYVSEQGVTVGVSGGRVEVKRKGEALASVRLIDVSQLCVFGNAQVSSQLVRELFRRQVPICWFSYGGWFSGLGEGLPSKHVDLRRRQVAIAHQGGLDIARRIVEGKIRNCRTLLRRNSRRSAETALRGLRKLSDDARGAVSIAALLGIEGTAARIYFDAFTTMLRDEHGLPGRPFNFDGRSRRPPLDPINCLLSYAYSLLTKDLTAYAYAVGFDPYIGFYHRPRFGRPALALDLAEEFRPLIADSVVITLVNNGEVRPADFVVRAGGVALTPDGRRSVIAGYERRLDVEITHPMFGYKISYRRVLDVQARLLGAFLLGEVPEYVPLMTR